MKEYTKEWCGTALLSDLSALLHVSGTNGQFLSLSDSEQTSREQKRKGLILILFDGETSCSQKLCFNWVEVPSRPGYHIARYVSLYQIPFLLECV
jgi:hypothetical protein